MRNASFRYVAVELGTRHIEITASLVLGDTTLLVGNHRAEVEEHAFLLVGSGTFSTVDTVDKFDENLADGL